ncbi:MAG: GntR family transcriptional regulator [Chitinivibrionales bacterium]|nr:GntR family transcriptional regulator [Chitinivibrionales bacterium]
MTRSTPAQDRAVRALLEMVREYRADGRMRLPNYTSLATAIGVSRASIMGAVHRLREQGVLAVSHGSGVTILAEPGRQGVAREPEHPLPRLKWERLTQRLEHDISAGVFTSEVLPQRKQLARRYSVSYRTLAKSLQALLARGVLVRDGRRLWRAAMGRDSRDTVVLVAFGTERGEVGRVFPDIADQMHTLEQECLQQRMQLLTILANPDGGRVDRPSVPAGRLMREERTRGLAGFVVYLLGLRPDAQSRVLDHVLAYDRPVAVIAAGALQPRHLQHHRVRCFSAAFETVPGAGVARFLLGLGHRRVAYFSPFGTTLWSQQRLRGLRGTYESAGLRGNISEHVSALAPNFPPDAYDRTLAFVRRDVAGLITRTVDPGVSPDGLVTRHGYALLDIVFEEQVHRELRPLMHRALGEHQATAWVGANDLAAAACLDFLRGAGKRVPGDISVVGIDDSPLAVTRGLASYNFGSRLLLRSAVAHVLAGGNMRAMPTRRKGAPSVPVEGFVVPRASAGPVREG